MKNLFKDINKKSGNMLVFGIFVVVFITVILGSNYRGVRNEYRSSFNFLIDSITTNIQGSYYFFNSNHDKLVFYNYQDYKSFDIKSGDLIFKQAYSVPMYIYRKDGKDGKYKLHLKLNPVNDFGFYHNEKAVNNPPDAEVDSLYNQRRK